LLIIHFIATGDGYFWEPSLKATVDAWVAIFGMNGVHRSSARGMVMSSILVGNASFAKESHSETYTKVLDESRVAVTAIM
jgi:hypothetical protein